MRIAVICPDFPPATGGEAEYGLQSAKALASRGHDVVVFTRVSNCYETTEFEVRPVLIGKHTIDSKAMGRLRGFDVAHSINATWSWVERFGIPTFACAYGNDFISPNPVVGFDIKSRLRLPKGDAFDFWLSKWRTPRVMRDSLNKCQKIFCCSEFTRQKLIGLFPECAALTEVALPGVSSKYRIPRPAGLVQFERAATQFLTVCRLSEPRKNVDLVLRALAKLTPEFNFHYTIVGEGQLKPNLQLLAEQLGLETSVSFAGRVSDQEMTNAYQDADLFVLPSGITERSFEGFGIVYLEANAMGVPTMAVRAGGAQEAVDEGKSGFFVEAPTVEQIEEGLRSFLEGKRPFRSEDCQSFASHFTWERVVDQFEQAYENQLSCRA